MLLELAEMLTGPEAELVAASTALAEATLGELREDKFMEGVQIASTLGQLSSSSSATTKTVINK